MICRILLFLNEFTNFHLNERLLFPWSVTADICHFLIAFVTGKFFQSLWSKCTWNSYPITVMLGSSPCNYGLPSLQLLLSNLSSVLLVFFILIFTISFLFYFFCLVKTQQHIVSFYIWHSIEHNMMKMAVNHCVQNNPYHQNVCKNVCDHLGKASNW